MQLRQLTFLRFIAALGVIVFHYGTHVPTLAWAEPFWRFANTAVSFFFFLSGFILTHVYAARPITRRVDFYVSRAARILPLYVLALMAAAVFHLKQGTLRWDSLALNALVIQAWVPGYSQSINSAGWSLSVEVFFYLAFPLLLVAVARVESRLRLVLLLLGAWAANSALHVALVEAAQADGALTPLDDFSVYHPLTHLATFVAGMCAARLFTLERRACERWALLMIAAGLAGLAAFPLLPEAALRYHHNGLFTPLFVLLVLGLASAHGRPIARALAWRPLEFLGDISYGIYILQIPVAWFYFALLSKSGVALTADQKFALLCVVLIGSAAFCYLVVEAPLRSVINRYYQRLRTATPQPGPVARRLQATTAAQMLVVAPRAAALSRHPRSPLPAAARRSS
jgi:peptidoglycan/LPS O-acetylase OafA/YrhL